MVKLTVLYNLPDQADHDEFMKWRTTTHQTSNASMPKVLKTDFYVTKPTQMGRPAYKYITEAYFDSLADLEAAFFSAEAQEKLKGDLKRIQDPIFLISEEIVTTAHQAQ